MYTGREWLWELNVYDYRHRLYNPDNGRFLQSDSTGFDAGDMNLFRYCADDPVDHTDPMGLELQVQLQRDDYTVAPHQTAETAARLAAGTLRIYDNGKL